MNEQPIKDEYIDGLKEWGDHQYDPGYYLGKRAPVWMRSPGKPRWLAIIYIIPGAIVLGLALYDLYMHGWSLNLENVTSGLVGLFLLILSLLYGIKLWYKRT